MTNKLNELLAIYLALVEETIFLVNPELNSEVKVKLEHKNLIPRIKTDIERSFRGQHGEELYLAVTSDVTQITEKILKDQKVPYQIINDFEHKLMLAFQVALSK